jgi:hypothetical protein
MPAIVFFIQPGAGQNSAQRFHDRRQEPGLAVPRFGLARPPSIGLGPVDKLVVQPQSQLGLRSTPSSG